MISDKNKEESMYRVVQALLAVLPFILAASASAQGAWKPERNVEIVVGSASGSGTDRTARLIQSIWHAQRTLDVATIVTNKPGGGGGISWSYLSQHAGDPHYLLVTSYNIVTGHITGRSKLTYTDFTPLSLLISEYIVYSVRADAPFKTLNDLLDALKKDPGSVPVGLSSSVGGANHIALGLLVRAAGIDVKKMKVVVYPGTGQAVAALLGGHVGLFVNSASATAGPMLNGGARPLAIASPKRLPGPFAAVPTLTELGLPVVADNWRLVIAAKNLTDAQKTFWDGAFKQLAGSDDWKKELQDNHMSNNYRNSADTTRYIGEQYAEIREILEELGLARTPMR
jgi:putative tricarboxylic transport membrane protein